MRDTELLRYSLFPGLLGFPFFLLKKVRCLFEVAKPPSLFRAKTYIGSTVEKWSRICERTSDSGHWQGAEKLESCNCSGGRQWRKAASSFAGSRLELSRHLQRPRSRGLYARVQAQSKNSSGGTCTRA